MGPGSQLILHDILKGNYTCVYIQLFRQLLANVKNSWYRVCWEIGKIWIVFHLTGPCVTNTNHKTVIKKPITMHLIVNENDNLVEVRGKNLSILRQSMYTSKRELGTRQEISMCTSVFRENGQSVKKKVGGLQRRPL